MEKLWNQQCYLWANIRPSVYTCAGFILPFFISNFNITNKYLDSQI